MEAAKITEIQNIVISTLEAAYKNDIGENDYEALQKARALADEEVANYNLDRNLEDT